MTVEIVDAQSWWWQQKCPRTGNPYELVNGVFKGGGARGAAYSGALQAVEGNGLWFGAVAGASAGAITAALIAAGVGPQDPAGSVEEGQIDFASATRDGLGSMRLAVGTAILGWRDSLYDVVDLQKWLEDVLRRQLHLPDGAPPVAFGQLLVATGIELYVVAMDLATGAPIVFSAETTPAISVSVAVVASCAIPGALPAGRAAVKDGSNVLFDQLVDGGAWANFPRFVFTDPQFRRWLVTAAAAVAAPAPAAGADGADGRPTLGFVLDDDLTKLPPKVVTLSGPSATKRISEFDRGSSTSSASVALHSVGRFLGGNGGRVGLGIAALTTLAMTLVALPYVGRNLIAKVVASAAPDLVWPALLVVLLVSVIVAGAVVGLFVTAAAVFGRALGKTVLPAASAALGVATGTPPWIGQPTPAFEVIRVPAVGLATLSFHVKPEVVARITERARWDVAEAVNAAARRLHWPTGFVPPDLDTVRDGWQPPPAATPPSPPSPPKVWVGVVASGVFALGAIGAIAATFFVLERSTYAGPLSDHVAAAWCAVLVLVALALWFAPLRAMRRVAARVVAVVVIVFAVMVAISTVELLSKARFLALAGLCCLVGLACLILLLTRGAHKAHERAYVRFNHPAKPGWFLLAGGLILVGIGAFGSWRFGGEARDGVLPAMVIASSATAAGVDEAFCLDEDHELGAPCLWQVTVHDRHPAYRVGDLALLRPDPHRAGDFRIVIAPRATWLVVAVMIGFIGVGFLVSAYKHLAFARRLRDEDALKVANSWQPAPV